MKYQLLFFGFLIVASCLQCSDSKKLKEKEKKEEITKTIKTVIIYGDYPRSFTKGGKYYPERFRRVREMYCYKTPEHYDHYSFLYKGDIVDGKLIARVYKKDKSSFEFPLKTSKDQVNNNKAQYPEVRMAVQFFYSGEEVRLEVRRVNKEKNEDVLLYEKEIPDMTVKLTEEDERKSNEFTIHGSGFSKERGCYRSPG